MKNIFLLLFVCQYFTSNGQDTFIKEIDNANYFDQSSITATNDKGWLILAKTSVDLIKYNQCGGLEWSKSFDITNQNCCIGTQIVLGPLDQIYLLSREPVGPQDMGYRITALTNIGDVIWSKSYAQSGVDYFPYSLMMDEMGDLIVFANITGTGTGFSTLTKLHTNGNIKWSKKYDNGGTWGEAIITQDTGVLMRRGDEFIKVDSAGGFEWATQITSSSTYYYSAPVEVSDGYIFTKQVQGGQGTIFYKMDKQGNMLFGGGQNYTLSETSNPLRNAPNGNFVTIFNTNTTSPTASSLVIEFDKDLNIVKQNAISLNTTNWYVNDLSFTKQNVPVVVGKYVQPNLQHIVFGKLDTDYKVGCDSIITPTATFFPSSFNSQPMGVSTNAITPVDRLVVVTNTNLTDLLTCGNTAVSVVTLANDTVICSGIDLTLQNLSSSSFTDYLWSTGETTPTISVNTSGTYWLTASNSCNSSSSSDTVTINVIEIQDPNLITDTALCGDNSILLEAEVPLGQYLWQDNSTSPTYLVTQSGDYYVNITVGACMERFDAKILACEEFIIPNIFTPNGDGINDYFEVLYFGTKSLTCAVYNRWGVLVFEAENVGFKWDGTVNGTPVSDGIYIYLIQIGEEKLQGSFTLVR